MRPLNRFEDRLILSYVSQPLVTDIRYKCLRAVEVDAAYVASKESDYYQAMLALSNAIRAELGLGEFDENDAPVVAAQQTMAMASPMMSRYAPKPEPAPMAAMTQAVESDGQTDMDKWDVLEELGIPDTAKKIDKEFKKSELLDTLYGTEDKPTPVPYLDLLSLPLEKDDVTMKKADLIKHLLREDI